MRAIFGAILQSCELKQNKSNLLGFHAFDDHGVAIRSRVYKINELVVVLDVDVLAVSIFESLDFCLIISKEESPPFWL